MNKNFLYFLLIILVMFGCSKKIVVPAYTANLKETLTIEEIDFEYFHGRARLVLKDADREREVKANIRIRKDSVIWMTFNVIGIQGGKALINHDSITIVSTLDKEYYVFDYAELSKHYNFEINYHVIQSAMLGNLLLPRQDDNEISHEHSFYILKQHSGAIDVVNAINAASMKIEKIELKENNSSNSVSINYSNFQPVGNKVFPYDGTVNIFYKSLKGLLNTRITLEYSKAEVGTRELNFPFNIPKRYERR